MQTANKQRVKEKRGRKRKEPITSITSHHKEFIRDIILLYENGAMNQNFDTGMRALSRFIHEKELLTYIKEGQLEPLLFSSIETEVNTVWREIKTEREKINQRKSRT